jgi:hypothetical protein
MVTFPEAASDIELDKDALGKTVFRFEMDEPASALGYLLWVWLALMAAGIGRLLLVLLR